MREGTCEMAGGAGECSFSVGLRGVAEVLVGSGWQEDQGSWRWAWVGHGQVQTGLALARLRHARCACLLRIHAAVKTVLAGNQ